MATRPPLTGDVHQTWPGKRWWHKPGPWCKFKARTGRRGAMLFTLGVLYVLIGYGEVYREQAHYSGAFHLLIPNWVRLAIWAFCGAGAIYFAFTRHHPGDGGRWWQTDAYGWLLLYAAPMIRALSYLGSFLLWLFTDQARVPPLGDPAAIVPMIIWAIPVAMVLICSGWLENPRREHCP